MTASNGPRISRSGSSLPPRIIFHGVEGIGKTSFGAQAPKPIFLMIEGETGLLTLLDHKLVTETDHFDPCNSWQTLLDSVTYLIKTPRDNQTLVIDTLNGAAALCFRHVCNAKFGGKQEKFLAYAKGPEIAQAEWAGFLALLDQLRERGPMWILALCHTRVKSYNNPLGDNYDRFTPDLHEKLWGLAAKWSDIVLFGNFHTLTRKPSTMSKVKGVGGTRRMLYTERSAAWDAKNRMGMPRQIELGMNAQEGWNNFVAALKGASATPSTRTENPKPVKPSPPQPQSNGTPHAPSQVTTPTAVQLERLAELRQELFERTAPEADAAELTAIWRDQVLAKRGVTTARALSPQQASELIATLEHHLATLDLSDDLYAEDAPTGATGGTD